MNSSYRPWRICYVLTLKERKEEEEESSKKSSKEIENSNMIFTIIMLLLEHMNGLTPLGNAKRVIPKIGK